MSGKICKECGEFKELNCFHKDNEKKQGVKNICKECRKTGKEKLTDSRISLHKSINSSIYNAIKNNRKFTWNKLLDYEINELKEYLEQFFEQDMTWENYGKVWKIGRVIKPKEYGNSRLIQEIKKCWSIKNSFPMYKKSNVKANNILIESLSLYDILPIGYKILDKK